eukprot:6478551-Amphidinium_carterae.1
MLRATGMVVSAKVKRGIGVAPMVATVDLAGFTLKSKLPKGVARNEMEDWSNSAEEAMSTRSSAYANIVDEGQARCMCKIVARITGAMSVWKARMLKAHPCGVPREDTLLVDKTPACFQDNRFSRHALATKSVNSSERPDAKSIAEAFSRFKVGNAFVRSTTATKTGLAALI